MGERGDVFTATGAEIRSNNCRLEPMALGIAERERFVVGYLRILSDELDSAMVAVGGQRSHFLEAFWTTWKGHVVLLIRLKRLSGFDGRRCESAFRTRIANEPRLVDALADVVGRTGIVLDAWRAGPEMVLADKRRISAVKIFDEAGVAGDAGNGRDGRCRT